LKQRLYTTTELAGLVGCSPRALEARRHHDQPPVYERVGKRVVYMAEDVEPWLNTSEARAMRARASRNTDRVCETTRQEDRAGG
jgi:hypothetical protein